ncbi:hypothetical protein E6O75_ATG04627 [Venturia nashicola]|uniref:Uncharacterized protein n=1 Tax=Venturia nashicola TaxID=86259 RepID=A0A4Z1NYM4_9PEZI|nr:hypothetical protein E6O75_ATG04627 [Venturia nashicola]
MLQHLQFLVVWPMADGNWRWRIAHVQVLKLSQPGSLKCRYGSGERVAMNLKRAAQRSHWRPMPRLVAKLILLRSVALRPQQR